MYATSPMMAASDQNGSIFDGCSIISVIINIIPTAAATDIRFSGTPTRVCYPYLCARREAALKADHTPTVWSHLPTAVWAAVCLEISCLCHLVVTSFWFCYDVPKVFEHLDSVRDFKVRVLLRC